MSPRRSAARLAALLALALAAGSAEAQPGTPPAPAAAAPQAASQEALELEAAGAPIGPETRRAATVRLLTVPAQDEGALRPLLELREGEPVTAPALRRTVLQLFRSGRCRDAQVREREAPPRQAPGAWVDLTVTCLGHRQVAALDLQLSGTSPVGEAALRTAAALDVGAAADDEDLEAAASRVRALLWRRGHREAQVAVRATDERTAAVTVEVKAGPPTHLAALELQGAGALEPALRRALALRPGATLDEEKLGEDLVALRRALHASGHWRGRIGSPSERPVAGGVAVAIAVVPGPRIEVTFPGAQTFTAAELRTQLGLAPEQPFDRQAAEAAQDRLRAFYRAHAFAAARVTLEERGSGDRLELRFRVAEGRRYALAPLAWEGADHRPVADLDARLGVLLAEETPSFAALPGEERARLVEASLPGVPPPRQPPPIFAPGRYLDEVTLSRALDGIVDDYRADGWLDAVVLGWSSALDDRTGQVSVTVRVREGRRVLVEAIEFTGQKVVPLSDLTRLAQAARLAPDQPLVWERVAATKVAILNHYRSLSYLYAKVTVKQGLDTATALAHLRFEIDEGPQVSIGRIVVSGNTTTRESVIRGALAVKEHALYDPSSLDRSQAALLRLGVFRSVGLRLQDPEVAEPVKDLLVEVSERPWQTVTASAGFSLANGPRVGLEWSRPNLAGRALELSATGKFNYPLAAIRPDLERGSFASTYEGRGDVGLRVPKLGFLPWQASARAGVGAERAHRPSFDLTRGVMTGAVDSPIASHLTVSLQEGIEVDGIAYTSTAGVPTQADTTTLRYQPGTTTLNSVMASAVLDLRDNAANPRSGALADFSVEHFRNIGGPGGRFLFIRGSEFPANAVKLQAGVSGYLPLGRGTVLAAAIRVGRIVAVTGSSVTIAPKRFYMGGAGTLRGYSEDAMVPEDQRADLAAARAACAASASDPNCTSAGKVLDGGGTVASVGGQAFVLGKVEIRQAMPLGLELGLFLDAGNLWYDPSNVQLLDLRPSAGVGLRMATPVGPIVFDFGFNLRPDRNLNEPSFAPHFTIGLF